MYAFVRVRSREKAVPASFSKLPAPFLPPAYKDKISPPKKI